MATFQVDGENADANLAAAQAAMNEADGVTPETKEEESNDAESNEETSDEDKGEEEAGEKKPGDLSLTPDKKEETKQDEEESKEEPKDGDAPETLNMQTFYNEYAETGELSEESRSTVVERLTAAGFEDAEGLLNQYLGGADASRDQIRSTAFSITGGEEGYQAMGAWAQENLSPAELAAYDQAVTNPSMVPLAVRGLFSQYQAATGAGNAPAPSRVSAGPNTAAGVKPVTSIQQSAELTADPRMDTDPAYRAEVNARITAGRKMGAIK